MISNTKPSDGLGSVLRSLRARYGLRQEDLAQAASVATQYVSIIERGKSPKSGKPPRVSPEILQAFGSVLGDSDAERQGNTAELLRVAGYTAEAAPVGQVAPLPTAEAREDLARAVAEKVTQSLRDLIDADPRLRRVVPVRHDQQRIPADGTAPMDDVYTDLPGNTDRLVALTVRGHCMEPDIRDGETVVIDTERPAELKDVVAVYLEGDWTLKRLRKRNGVWLLVPDNTNYEPIEIDPTKVRVLGVVVQVSRGKP